jgi:hypothetical protein
MSTEEIIITNIFISTASQNLGKNEKHDQALK